MWGDVSLAGSALSQWLQRALDSEQEISYNIPLQQERRWRNGVAEPFNAQEIP